jgi:putative hydrolase of the HAD superfamily
MEPADAVMVGDSLDRDIHGALAAGLGAVWLNRSGAEAPAGITRVSTLAELPAALA